MLSLPPEVVTWWTLKMYFWEVVNTLSELLGCLSFLADVNSRSRSLNAVAVPSVCLSVCLSSVTLVRPTQPVEIFRQFFFHHTIGQGL